MLPGVQVISAAEEHWIHPFTGLQPRQFRKLIRLVARRGGDQIADGRPGRQSSLWVIRSQATATTRSSTAPAASTRN